jgi:aspartyl-tRNA(Asn)/glutamyl-tRNA(Gln) amidotransferase subunit A
MTQCPCTITEIQNDLRAGVYTAVDLVRVILDDIANRNSQYNAFLEVFDDVLDQAAQADARRRSEPDLPLLGVPIAIKDNILVSGQVASASSKILANHRAVADARVIAQLRQAGAVLIIH